MVTQSQPCRRVNQLGRSEIQVDSNLNLKAAGVAARAQAARLGGLADPPWAGGYLCSDLDHASDSHRDSLVT